jgi:hypothetical protein
MILPGSLKRKRTPYPTGRFNSARKDILMAKGPGSERSKSKGAPRAAKMRLSHLRTRKRIQQIKDERADRIATGRPKHVKIAVRS